MLRISVLNGPTGSRLKLEGKLAHEWVYEAEKAWQVMKAMKGNAEIVVDLMDVSYVDDAGHTLLSAMRRAGSELLGHGPLMSALIAEIEEAEAGEQEIDDTTEHDSETSVDQHGLGKAIG